MKNETDYQTLGEMLRHLREEKSLMQREVGAVIEVDGAFISKVENNEKPINRKHLNTLSKFFKVQEDELQTLWLSDKIYNITHSESTALPSLNTVINRIKEQQQ